MENHDMSQMTEIEIELAKAELEKQKAKNQLAGSETKQENTEIQTTEEKQVQTEDVERKDIENPQIEETQPDGNNNLKIDCSEPAVREQFALMRRSQTGSILGNIGIVCFAICAFILVGTILAYITIGMLFVFAMAILIGLFVVTVGGITLAEGYRELWAKLFSIMDHSEKLAQIVNFLIGTIPYFVAVGAVSSILSIVFMSTAKTQKSVGRIVASSIFLGLYVIVFILVLTGVKAQ